MKVGLNLPVINDQVTPSVLSDLAVLADQLGFAELYLGEHVVLFDDLIDTYPGTTKKATPFPPQASLPDPLIALSFLATATDQIRLATGILILPQRNPIYTAKQLATLDWLSGGRVDVGIGLGWNRLEFAALAVPWARRGDRCDEYVDLIRTLWRDDPAEHHGEFWELASCHQFPKPAQKPGPPLWFGGTSDRALARVATRGDGWYLFDPRPDSLARRLIVLDELLIAAGRTRRDVTVVVGTGFPHPTLREVEGYAEAGASQVVVSLSGAAPDAMRAELQALAEDLAIGRGPAMSGT